MATNDHRRETGLLSMEVPGKMDKAHRRSCSLTAADWEHTLVSNTPRDSISPSVPASSPYHYDAAYHYDAGPHLLSPAHAVKTPYMFASPSCEQPGPHLLSPDNVMAVPHCQPGPHLLSPYNVMTVPESEQVPHLLSPDHGMPVSGEFASPLCDQRLQLLSLDNVMKEPDATPVKENVDRISSFESVASPLDSPLPLADFGSLTISVADIENNETHHELLGSPPRRSQRIEHPAGGFSTDFKPSRYNLQVLGEQEKPSLEGPPSRIFVRTSRRRCQSETLPRRTPAQHRRDSYASLKFILDSDLLRNDFENVNL